MFVSLTFLYSVSLLFTGLELAIPIGLFYFLSCFPFETSSNRSFNLLILTVASFYLISSSNIASTIFPDQVEIQKSWLGLNCVGILVSFYASPLSTMVRVIKTKNSASISLPLTVTTLMAASFWGIYGLLISDYFIFGPNVLGVFCAVTQLILTRIYPSLHFVDSKEETVVVLAL